MRDIISEIWQTARRNKLRTTLTGFAVAWGIFMIIVLLGAGNGLINANVKQTSNWLTNSMEAYGGYTSKAYKGLGEGRGINLNTKDLAATEKEFASTIDDVGAVYYHSARCLPHTQSDSEARPALWPTHQPDRPEGETQGAGDGR